MYFTSTCLNLGISIPDLTVTSALLGYLGRPELVEVRLSLLFLGSVVVGGQ